MAVAAVLLVGLVGAVLGMRHVVLSVVPTFLVMAVVLAAVAVATGMTPGRALGLAMLLGFVLQAGYLAGVAVRHLLVCARARALAAPGSAPLETSEKSRVF
ncbi:hypothetical protein PQJ75_08335 [Rhodoplanes sp. TEM]|uniref:Uncharacterized protein n=1 Tax=Rhodoplanes tepidamans TaxID=200616 RepID=A0ABT5JB02_RHOTP|nr:MULTISPECIES: hypothetical protein [Rhodoplanes]MDC7786728.1 hypothetical protein [Rhodoplanes tepidamans]MDC7983734.1 hypothetical protein [Rhodoplanes sp. TEM]MDQ0358165.1 putative membrane protein [Rhodoplanes tepidamans]